MKAFEIIKIIEENFPLAYQESYDNAGLCIGDTIAEISGILCCIDVTEEVLDEAILKQLNMVISHHPVIFQGLKSITSRTLTERIILKAIKNNILLYSAHTNADNAIQGVNKKICDKIGLVDCKILAPAPDKLVKFVIFVPQAQAEKIRSAIFEAGAGVIGNYDCCSFNVNGNGTFRGNELTNQFVGDKNELHSEPETRIETILPSYLSKKVVSAAIKAHPYEEVAYDLYALKNNFANVGSGMIGEFSSEITLEELLFSLKNTFNAKGIRYSGVDLKPVKKIAVCGGSGSFLINEAKRQNADVFITGDIKYHQFFDADKSLSIIDMGHYESEQFTKEIFYELLIKNLSKFAVHLSEINSNPIKYFS
jgi:dinuclear metal center YbgI/SA1388 family protein